MDASLLSTLGAVLQTYASLLGIIGMFLVFLKQYKDSKIRDLETRLRIKADSLVDFINREIATAYDNEPTIRVDSQNYDDAIKAIEEYRSERKNDIPHIDTENVKRLLILWTIAEREKEALIQLRNESILISKKPILPSRSLMFFISYFTLELLFGFLGVLLVMIEHSLQYSMTMITVILAIIGLVPLGNLLYKIR